MDQGPGGTTAQFEPTRKAQVPNWKVYATQNMELIGLSGTPEGEREAIVSDRKAGQIHILQVEQEMVAGENQFKLIRIATDHVVFEKDGEEIEVK